MTQIQNFEVSPVGNPLVKVTPSSAAPFRITPRASSSTSLARAAQAAPYLTREEEHALAVRWKDEQDQDALHRLTQAHMRLVLSVAHRFRHFGLPASDLAQEGHVGLLEAASRFEPDRGVRFSTYATWWIRASIQDYVLRNWSIVRGSTSSTQKALFFNLRRLRAKLARENEGMSDEEMHKEIALAIGVPKNDVSHMASRLSAPDHSLNASISEGESGSAERQDFLVDDEPTPDQSVEILIDGERRVAWLQEAMGVLNPRERKVLAARRLQEDEDTRTLEDIGFELGISKERVRQIEARAMEKLRDALVAAHPEMAF